MLRQRGVAKVRPLAGGFDAWRRGGFRLDPVGEAPADGVEDARRQLG